jgi:hypothetical protein
LSHINTLQILLTKGPIHELFTKKYCELAELKNELFLVGHLDFFQKKMLYSQENKSKFIG